MYWFCVAGGFRVRNGRRVYTRLSVAEIRPGNTAHPHLLGIKRICSLSAVRALDSRPDYQMRSFGPEPLVVQAETLRDLDARLAMVSEQVRRQRQS